MNKGSIIAFILILLASSLTGFGVIVSTQISTSIDYTIEGIVVSVIHKPPVFISPEQTNIEFFNEEILNTIGDHRYIKAGNVYRITYRVSLNFWFKVYLMNVEEL